PMVAMEAMEAGINKPLAEGLAAERKATRKVFGSPVAANLISIFFHTTQLKSDPGVDDASIEPMSVGRVGVIGAGLMGSGIATACARRGLAATMMDLDAERLEKGMAAAQKVVESRIKIGRATPKDMVAMLSRLSTTTDTAAQAGADLIVEAVTEDLELKKKVFGGLNGVVGPETIVASNTSTLSITAMADHAPDAARFVGMHFFSPVDRMELVEVIRGERTSDRTVATVVAAAKRIGKTPIVVGDCPGFCVNRLLMPYMAEALLLLVGGIDMDRIDRVAVRFGMPMGPIALYDLVGIDVGYYAGGVMAEGYADRAVPLPPVLKAMMDAGRLGQKSGRGFRAYDKKGKPVPDPEVHQILEPHVEGHLDLGDEQILDRLFGCMALEAARAMDERIVRSPGHLDMAMILGTGYPPFRGGPLKWMDDQGLSALLERWKPLAELGARFQPPESLVEMAKEGRTFHRRPEAVAGAEDR
ncbi:MAG: 3-hydroxyacyl-CoA dehydrogenase NAD-binding domain-containing protein, partial [Phycisphaeraceae bacterium]|nr:3-hydroxyacyl-CoA dehydrogenase NAD-binding domain-containing protein [Phycisphaeraceae bacterium]